MRAIAILLLCTLLACWSCRIEKDSYVLPPVKELITVQEAKSWYQASANKATLPATITLDNRLVYWDGAQNTYLTNGTPVISVPLFYNYRKPIIVAQDAVFTRSEKKLPLLEQSIDDLQINKRLLIGKDGKGGYRACVIVSIPTDKYKKANSRILTKTYAGSQLYYSENELNFMLAMQFDNGQLTNVLRPVSTKPTHLSCYKAIYQSTPPDRIEGLRQHLATKTKELKLPMIFQDKTGVIYSLFDIVYIDCDTGIIGTPIVASK